MKRYLHLPRKRRLLKSNSKSITALSDSVTEILRKIVILLLIAIVLSQLALQFPKVRIWITGVDRMEGSPF